MRTGLTLLVCAAIWLLAACAGASTPTVPLDGEPAAAGGSATDLASLPAPRAASAGASVVQVEPGSSSHFIQTNLHPVHEAVGVTQEIPDWFHLYAARSPEQLPHHFMIIQHQQGDEVTMGQLSLDLIWQGEAPEGSAGFYVGVADHRARSWRWLGPMRGAGDIMDYAPMEIAGDPDMNNRLQLALVNYSPVPVKLKYISFTTIDPEETTGDERLFFLTEAGGSFALNSVASGDLDSPEQLHQFSPGEEVGGLAVCASETEQLLVFNHRSPGGDWQVWQCDLDGGAMQVRHSGSGDVRFGGFDAGKHCEFTLVDGGEHGKIQRHNLELGSVDYERDLPGAIIGTPEWYMLNSPAIFSLYGTGLDELGQQMTMQYVYYDYGEFDSESYRELVFILEEMETKDPHFFNWGHNQDPSSNAMTLFSGRTPAEDTFDIRLNIFCNGPNINNEVFVGDQAADLSFPALSPDHKLLSFLRSEPGAETGQLVVQSAFLREMEQSAVVAENVSGPAVWFDPTPLA
ncbi:MAG TPA: hypothetical protein ENO21_01020, partial [Firmicutes bacterium]|nr:hypothetical protein [Bacillota bacterium]